MENAGRLVSSAKSWLSHSGVDRTARHCCRSARRKACAKISPVEATARYLEHLRQAWDAKMPDAPFTEQQVLVTVPASFDAVARELTLEAAEQAGYQNITLLEEPQAAFYAWIERHTDWRERVKLGDLILVVDIGGGTTDFTLIAVTEQTRRTVAERVAVGEHILLGGDNIDLALAGVVAHRLAEKGTRIDSRQLHALWHNCRVAKEKLLRAGIEGQRAAGHDSGKRHGAGGRHDQGHAAARRYRAGAGRRLFPRRWPAPICPRGSGASDCRRSACRMPPMPPITRHMARFLRQQASTAEHGIACAAGRAVWPAPRMCCSMAACCTPA